jgi:TRAP-type mannitol/chloroaromatic compound transport system permease small subunit
VKHNEVGKVFSMLAVVSAIAPMIGGPVFRQIYNFTLNTYPGAVFFIFAGFMLVAVAANVFVFLNRNHIKEIEETKENVIEEKSTV